MGNFEAKSDIGIFLRYSSNSQAYWVYNLRASTMMKSNNAVINDSKATRKDESKDNDVFSNGSTIENVVAKVEAPSTITLIDPRKFVEEGEEPFLLK